MEKIELIVDVPRKTFSIDGKPMNLEDTFTDASIDHSDSNEPVVNLRYEGRFSEDNSPIEREADKLRETYGEGLFESLNISGSELEDAHYVSIYGKINPTVLK